MILGLNVTAYTFVRMGQLCGRHQPQPLIIYTREGENWI